MRAAIFISPFLLGLFLFLGCGSQEPPRSETGGLIPSDALQHSQAPNESPRDLAADPLLIREATIVIEVEDYGHTAIDLSELATASEGFVLSRDDRLDSSHDRRAGTVVLKVPGARFNAVLDDISELAQVVTSRQVSVEDVTEEVIDLDARLRVKRELEERYLQLLQGAVSTSDALEVEQALAAVREDIESLQGQLQLLERRVELSVITVELSEPEPFLAKLGAAWHIGTEILHYLIAAVVALAVGLSPLAVALVLFLLFLRYVIRRRRAGECGLL